MSPELTFFAGLALLLLLFWYFSTDIPSRKRLIGLSLTILFTAFSIAEFWPPDKKIAYGLDIAGGSSFLLQLQPNPGQQITEHNLESAVEVIRRRIDNFGVSEPVINTYGQDHLLVQLPGLKEEQVQEARERLERVAKLEFRLVNPETAVLAPKVESGEEFLIGWQVLPQEEKDKDGKIVKSSLLVSDKPDVEGKEIESAYPQYGIEGYYVGLKFTSEGAKRFGEITQKHAGQRFAIVLDGVIISAPRIDEPILTGSAVIRGSFTEQEVRELSSSLENPLQTGIKIVEERSVSPTLGKDSINSGVYSGLVGLALTFLFVLIYYRFPGLVANVGLVVNIAILLGVMSMFHFVLTLPGIAGIILTIGMAIDANVLIYERLREELNAGKSLKYAIDAAYEKAFSSIFDANVTTLITALILFWLASGPVKGFAVTLTVGIIASMFSALLVTRNCFDWALHLGWIKKITMLDLVKGKNFNFLGKRKVAITGSTVVLLICAAAFAIRGEKNFGTDFTGGDIMVLSANQNLSPAQIRNALKPINFDSLPIQEEKSGERELVTVRAPFGARGQIEKQLTDALPDAGLKVEQVQSIGPVIGKQLAWGSLMALLTGILGILIYVTFRFEFSFALGSIVALLHDVLITVGVFAIMGRELSLIMVGAILTIAGYSINDTIVVFDRIREGLKSGRRGSIESIMNQSINETLSRTILTGGTTMMTVLALFLFGGPVLNDFALAMLIGMVVGTYSSIYIAAPVVLWWAKFRGTSLRREVIDAEMQPVAPARS